MRNLVPASRQLLYGILSPLIVKVAGRSFQPGDALIISGYFRSGTTWLAEMVAQAVNGGIVFEPFHLDHVSRARPAGFTYDNYRPANECWPEGAEFVDQVLRGKVLNRWTAAHIPLRRAANMHRLVVKLVSANQMLPWLTTSFPIKEPILLIRHPCAVLASWMNRGWRLNSWIRRDEKLIRDHPEIESVLVSLKYDEEFFAAKWCIDHYVPLTSAEKARFVVVPYEKLVLGGQEYLMQLLRFWLEQVPRRLHEEMSHPSAKASQELRRDYSSALHGWQKTLSVRQRDRVLRVVRDFGLDFYGREAEPDYDQLLGTEPVSLRR